MGGCCSKDDEAEVDEFEGSKRGSKSGSKRSNTSTTSNSVGMDAVDNIDGVPGEGNDERRGPGSPMNSSTNKQDKYKMFEQTPVDPFQGLKSQCVCCQVMLARPGGPTKMEQRAMEKEAASSKRNASAFGDGDDDEDGDEPTIPDLDEHPDAIAAMADKREASQRRGSLVERPLTPSFSSATGAQNPSLTSSVNVKRTPSTLNNCLFKTVCAKVRRPCYVCLYCILSRRYAQWRGKREAGQPATAKSSLVTGSCGRKGRHGDPNDSQLTSQDSLAPVDPADASSGAAETASSSSQQHKQIEEAPINLSTQSSVVADLEASSHFVVSFNMTMETVLKNLSRLGCVLHMPELKDLEVDDALSIVDRMQELKLFDLSYQPHWSAEVLNSCLRKITHVQHLSLYGTFLGRSGDAQEILTECLPQFTKLATLQLGNNGLGEAIVSIFAAVGSSLPELRYLDLSNNKMTPKCVTAVAHCVRHTRKLHTFIMSGNSGCCASDDSSGVADLAMCFLTMDTINHVDFSKCRFNEEASTQLAQNMDLMSSSLEYLDLSGNSLDSVEVSETFCLQLQNMTNLTHLNLDSCCISAEHLAKALPMLPKLRFLSARKNYVETEGVGKIVGSLREHPSPQHLIYFSVAANVKHGIWREATTVTLAEGVSRLRRLKILDLAHLLLDDVCMRHLGPALTKCTQLVEVHFEGNELTCDGIAAIAPSFTKMPHLRRLILRRNKIGDDGAEVLARNLALCPLIQELSLNFNDIGDDGLAALCQHLFMNRGKQLRKIWLNNNKITSVGVCCLAPAVQKMKSLRFLYLDANSIGDDGAEALARAFAKAHSVLQNHHSIMESSARRQQLAKHGGIRGAAAPRGGGVGGNASSSSSGAAGSPASTLDVRVLTLSMKGNTMRQRGKQLLSDCCANYGLTVQLV